MDKRIVACVLGSCYVCPFEPSSINSKILLGILRDSCKKFQGHKELTVLEDAIASVFCIALVQFLLAP